MLGLYDSGLGGLSVLAALRAEGIDDDIVYFADQAHVPYGDKSDAALHGYLDENLALLGSLGVEAVVMACNTSCAIAQTYGWPSTAFPVLDLIDNAATALARTQHRSIAVIATVATVRSGAYTRAIRSRAARFDVCEIAAPALVPLVERGETDTPAARDAVEAVVAQLPAGIDALVYGCTHYPLLDRWFAATLEERVARIDPAAAQATATAAHVAMRPASGGTSTTSYYTNGDPRAFEAGVRRWTGDRTGRVASLVAR